MVKNARESSFLICSHLLGHRDPLAIDECKHFVVIHHRVHALNPQCVNGPVEHDPLLTWFLILSKERRCSVSQEGDKTNVVAAFIFQHSFYQ